MLEQAFAQKVQVLLREVLRDLKVGSKMMLSAFTEVF